jgi:hypothetical protein
MKMDNINAVMVKFAKQLNIPLTSPSIYDELLIHPDYPSLFSVSDILIMFNIENPAFRIEADEIKGIPTMLLNGYLMPGLYQLNDLKYMLI